MPCAGNLPSSYQQEFLPVFNKWKESRKPALTSMSLQHYFSVSKITDFARVLWFDNANITVPSSYRDDVLTSEEVAALLLVYQAMYPEEPNITFGDLHITIKKFSSIFVGAEKYGSKAECRSLRSARVLASWQDGQGNISPTSSLSPGIVDYYMCHKLTLSGVEREHHFAFVRWLKKHPQAECLGGFNTICVWDGSNFESTCAPCCFLPVHRIHSLFTGGFLHVDNINLLAVCPIPRKVTVLSSS